MRVLTCLLLLLAVPLSAQQGPVVTVTAADPTGALLVGARVQLEAADGVVAEGVTDGQGVARLPLPRAGRYTLRVESPGFEPATQELTVRGDTRRTLRLALAKVLETVDVGRDPRARGSDPRDDIFATVLGEAQIQELPDDPDEMERVLREMAGPGAVMRVNGFRGGRLPPKDQIARIRFRRNMFAADTHEPGFIAVDIVTRPGMEQWRGATGFGFRDTVLNARNALAPVRGDERFTRGSFTLSGPLWRGRSSLALSVDGSDAFDAQTIVAALPGGSIRQNVRRPSESANVSARFEHALSGSQQLRAEYQRNGAHTDNLGVGNFDLASRGYGQSREEQVVRGSLTGSIGTSMYNELRISFRQRELTSTSATQEPAVVVLNAFTSGGAQVDGARSSADWEAADDLDVSRGRHALRAGVLLQAGRYRTTELRNGLGTYTFASLADYDAGRPSVFTRTVGDPRASLVQAQVGVYAQDDYRATRALTLSGGVRVESQSPIGGVHVGPRGGFAWAPTRSGNTTLRGGGGIFFDWLDAQDHLRAVQTDGTRQRIETAAFPSFPIVDAGGLVSLINGRTTLGRGLTQPRVAEVSLALDQTLFSAVRLSAMIVHRRGTRLLRGIDINAPAPGGARPDPLAGPITEVRSVARSAYDALSLNLNAANPNRRMFLAANYTLSRTTNEADAPFDLPADPANVRAERGPAADDARHRIMGFGTIGLGRGVTAGVSASVRSALPYDITTGRDDNGDTILRDRPAGLTRNSARGRASADVGARVGWRHGFGGLRPPAPGGPQVRIIRGDANPLATMPGGDGQERYGFELYAQAYNLLNRMNPAVFSGVLTSPFFGRAVAAAAPRRIELGARLTF